MTPPWEPEACARLARALGGPAGLEAVATAGAWPDVSRYDALFLDEDARAVVGDGFHFRLQEPRARSAPRGRGSYDAHIVAERHVPTRACSWHDLFNAVVWSLFPRAKLALHELQLEAQRERLTTDPTSRARSAAEDRLAMADEGGIVLAAPPREHQELARRVAAAPDALEALTRGLTVAVYPFGHAVLEHLLVAPCTVRAYPLLVCCAGLPSRVALDSALATHLADVRRGPPRKGVAVALDRDASIFARLASEAR